MNGYDTAYADFGKMFMEWISDRRGAKRSSQNSGRGRSAPSSARTSWSCRTPEPLASRRHVPERQTVDTTKIDVSKIGAISGPTRFWQAADAGCATSLPATPRAAVRAANFAWTCRSLRWGRSDRRSRATPIAASRWPRSCLPAPSSCWQASHPRSRRLGCLSTCCWPEPPGTAICGGSTILRGGAVDRPAGGRSAAGREHLAWSWAAC